MILMSEIDEICARLSSHEITRHEFVEQCVRFASRYVGCSRAGLWIFIESSEGRRLRCLGIYDRDEGRVLQVADEFEHKSGTYFAELERVGHVMANDVRTHPATSGFYEDNLRANDVRSLMAAAFSLNGHLFGAFTCTQVGEPMNWSIRQLAMLSKIGSKATLALAGASPTQLASLMAPL